MKKICIDPGHGGIHPGACYFGEQEKNLTLCISDMLRYALIDAGFSVIMTRYKDVDISLTDRCKIANRANCDLFISVHCNASYSKSVKGAEVYYWHTSAKGESISSSIQSQLANLTGCSHKKFIKNSTFTTLKKTAMPSIVVECGYMSNEDDFHKLCTTTYQHLVVQAIVMGVKNFFKQNGG